MTEASTVYKLGHNCKNKGKYIARIGPDAILIEWRIDGMSETWRTVERADDIVLANGEDLVTWSPSKE